MKKFISILFFCCFALVAIAQPSTVFKKLEKQDSLALTTGEQDSTIFYVKYDKDKDGVYEVYQLPFAVLDSVVNPLRAEYNGAYYFNLTTTGQSWTPAFTYTNDDPRGYKSSINFYSENGRPVTIYQQTTQNGGGFFEIQRIDTTGYINSSRYAKLTQYQLTNQTGTTLSSSDQYYTDLVNSHSILHGVQLFGTAGKFIYRLYTDEVEYNIPIAANEGIELAQLSYTPSSSTDLQAEASSAEIGTKWLLNASGSWYEVVKISSTKLARTAYAEW